MQSNNRDSFSNRGSFIFVFVLILIIIATSLSSIYDAAQLLYKQRDIVMAKHELQKIGVASLALFLQTRRVEVDRVWTLLGGIQKDFWDRPYRKDGRGKQTTWISSGPDGEFGTEDDLNVQLSDLSHQIPSLNDTLNNTEVPVKGNTPTVRAE